MTWLRFSCCAKDFWTVCEKMSGLKSEEAFAGALHVSLEELQTAERLRNPSPNVLIGLFEAFGFTPGEATIVEEQVVPRSQELVA